jgi:hypothetical protein
MPSRPEDALEEARRRAAAARERGGYADALEGMEIEPTERVTFERLLEWAVIEPDLDLVRSTRRLGGPITAVKRATVHVLRQYLGQMAAQQSRFNLMLATYVRELEDRVARLEERDREEPSGSGSTSS